MLSNSGHEICIIDKDPTAFQSLSRDFDGRILRGLGYDEDVLIEAGVEDCDVLAALTNNDNANLMSAEVGRKIFDVPHVITRLYSPDRENAYLQLGIDYVCGTTLAAEEIFSKIQSGHGHHIDTFGDKEILRFALDLGTSRKPIRVSDLEKSHEVRVAAVEHNGETLVPTGDTILHDSDILIAAVSTGYLGEFGQYMKK
jgi:trk system potassium uptake protein TrkA